MTPPTGHAIGAVVLHADDDVAVLIKASTAGESILAGGERGRFSIVANAALPLGHKIALHALAAQSDVRKYGEVIGRLTQAVAMGDHVHVHNLVSLRGH